MNAAHMSSRVLAACCLSVAAGAPAMAQAPDPIRADNWLYFQRNTDNSGQWKTQPRIFIPVGLGHGWTFTQRLDLPVLYTDQSGTDNPAGTWKAGIGDWFIEEIFATPALAENLRMWGSVRFVFPTGGSGPFGSDQYQWAPALSLIHAMPEHGITFSPVARYFMSFHAAEPSAAKIRKLTIFPTVTFDVPDHWTLAFYPENPISYNSVSHKWFVPIDLMLIKRLAKTVELGFGAAYAMVDDDPLYRSIVYGRLTFYF